MSAVEMSASRVIWPNKNSRSRGFQIRTLVTQKKKKTAVFPNQSRTQTPVVYIVFT